MALCDINWDLGIKAMQVVATIVVAALVYYFARRNMRYETQLRLGRFKYDKWYEAGMAFWGLLAYTTATENKKSIIVWEKKSGNKTYYLQNAVALEFMDKLNTINYEKGYGLFLNEEIRSLFYEYRNIVFGLLLKERNNPAEKITVENADMIKEMLQMHNKMVLLLRKEYQMSAPIPTG